MGGRQIRNGTERRLDDRDVASLRHQRADGVATGAERRQESKRIQMRNIYAILVTEEGLHLRRGGIRMKASAASERKTE